MAKNPNMASNIIGANLIGIEQNKFLNGKKKLTF
jgi:hypothetical protein